MICLELERTLIFHQQKAAAKTGDFLKNALLASHQQVDTDGDNNAAHDLAERVLFCDMAELVRQYAKHNIIVIGTKRQQQAAAAVSYCLINMKMFVSRDERIGMIQPVRVRHPPEPPRDSPVIQAVHEILPVLGPETAK